MKLFIALARVAKCECVVAIIPNVIPLAATLPMEKARSSLLIRGRSRCPVSVLLFGPVYVLFIGI
ncbi:MAG: hypothetical protein K0U72_11775 [Gammaproteobacteria bacterium]|nr:hypothetical protein [Gammaproteobacteria bacterium]